MNATTLPTLPEYYEWGYVRFGHIVRPAMARGDWAIYIDDEDDLAYHYKGDDEYGHIRQSPVTRYWPRKLVALFLEVAEREGWIFP